VLKKFNKLKTGKSAGLDGLHPNVLYEVKGAICYPLYVLFDQSVKDGTVPFVIRYFIILSLIIYSQILHTTDVKLTGL
jgi:hypothetical protein